MNIFGTDGIRNQVGTYPFTHEGLVKLGWAIGKWAYHSNGNRPLALVLAHDTRISCSWIKATLKSGLLMHPITLYDADILPTPALFHLIKSSEVYKGGIIISASHNTYTDNGIKLINAHGQKPSEEDEVFITDLMSSFSKEIINYACLGAEKILIHAQEQYIKSVLALFEPQFLRGKKIVLDTAHGAAYCVAPKIFQALGAEVITLSNKPNGININKDCGALSPELLQKTVIDSKADLGFAFDGDGDRVIAVNHLGHIKDGDDLLAILSNHTDYSLLTTLVGTLMSNQGLELYLTRHNKKLIRTLVGDKYVAQALMEHAMLLGGEQSGHIILRNIINTGDGIVVALKVIECLFQKNNWHMHSFAKYPQVLLNVPVKSKKDLSQSPLAEVILESKKRLNSGRLIVRYSGTENYLRIMVEALSQELAIATSKHLAHALTKALD